MRLFSSDKVPVTLVAGSFNTEKAPQHGETKVVKAVLEVELTAALGSAFVPTAEVRNTVFKSAEDGSLRPDLRNQTFAVAIPDQDLAVFATPDSEGDRVFDHVRFSTVAKTKVKGKSAKLRLFVTFGPVGAADYRDIGNWQGQQRFVTFTPSDPALALDDAQPSDADTVARETQPALAETEATPESAETERPRYPKRNAKKGRHLQAVPPVGSQPSEAPTEEAEAEAVSI